MAAQIEKSVACPVWSLMHERAGSKLDQLHPLLQDLALLAEAIWAKMLNLLGALKSTSCIVPTNGVIDRLTRAEDQGAVSFHRLAWSFGIVFGLHVRLPDRRWSS